MKQEKGFSLIELIVVIAVVAALGGMVIIRLVGSEAAARDTKRKSDLRQYQNALEIFGNDNGGLYPLRATAVTPYSLCGNGQPLGTLACPRDPRVSSGWVDYSYQSDNPGGLLTGRYVLWARLEKSAEYFVVCSEGQVGQVSTASFSGGSNCPL